MEPRVMINPRLVKTSHEKFKNWRVMGGKFYRATFEIGRGVRFGKVPFKTATGADTYATRVILRWMRLYDAAVMGQMEPTLPANPSPVVETEEGQLKVTVEA